MHSALDRHSAMPNWPTKMLRQPNDADIYCDDMRVVADVAAADVAAVGAAAAGGGLWA